jgi:hypothetical protein
MLWSWEVFTHVDVRQEALKGVELWRSLRWPRVRAALYIPSIWHLLRALSWMTQPLECVLGSPRYVIGAARSRVVECLL